MPPASVLRMTRSHPQAAWEPESVRPGVGKDGFECPHCGRVAHQVWAPLQEVELIQRRVAEEAPPKVLGASGGLSAASGGDRGRLVMQHVFPWQYANCARCGRPSVWRGEVMVYPQAMVGGVPHSDMPDGVRALYMEAAAVAAVSTRAGAAFARVTVERLLKHLFPDTDSRLEHLIAEAKRQGVSSSVGRMLDVVRVTGNGAVHVDDQPGDLVVLVLDDLQGPELVAKLLQAVNDLVDDLITKPRQAAELSALIPPHVQARIDQLSPPPSTNEP